MSSMVVEDFLASIDELDPAQKDERCREEARLYQDRADLLRETAEQSNAQASNEVAFAGQLLQRARLFHAEVVGTCKHLSGSSLNSSACELPIDHGDEMHAAAGHGWGNPPKKIRHWCLRCLKPSWFMRVKATRDDGTWYWRYRDGRGHFHKL